MSLFPVSQFTCTDDTEVFIVTTVVGAPWSEVTGVQGELSSITVEVVHPDLTSPGPKVGGALHSSCRTAEIHENIDHFLQRYLHHI